MLTTQRRTTGKQTPLTSAGVAFHILSYFSMLDLAALTAVCKEWQGLSREVFDKRLASTPSLLFESNGDNDFANIWTIRLFSLFINNSDLNISNKLALEIIQKNMQKIILRICGVDNDFSVDNDVFLLRSNVFAIQKISLSVSNSSIILQLEKGSFSYRESKKAAPEHKLSEQQLQLIDAIKNKETVLLRALLDAGVSPHTMTPDGTPVLVYAAETGYLEGVQALVEYNAKIEAQTSYANGQRTALLAAVWHMRNAANEGLSEDILKNYTEIIKFLVNSGANVNAQDYAGKTSLHYIVSCKVDVRPSVEFLIAKGANPDIADIHDRRPVETPFNLRGNIKNEHPMFAFSMNSDAKKFVQSCCCNTDGNYVIYFKKELGVREKYRAWEGVVNKLKSLKIDDPDHNLGMASDDRTITQSPTWHSQSADIEVPVCADYVAATIIFDQKDNAIKIKIDHRYFQNPYVKKTMEKLAAELKWEFSVVEEKKPTEHKLASFFKRKPKPQLQQENSTAAHWCVIS